MVLNIDPERNCRGGQSKDFICADRSGPGRHLEAEKGNCNQSSAAGGGINKASEGDEDLMSEIQVKISRWSRSSSAQS